MEIFLTLLCLTALLSTTIISTRNFKDGFYLFISILFWFFVCFFMPALLTFIVFQVAYSLFNIKISDSLMLYFSMPTTFILIIFYSRLGDMFDNLINNIKKKIQVHKNRKKEKAILLFKEQIKSMTIPKDLISKPKSYNFTTPSSRIYTENSKSHDYDEEDDEYDEWGLTKDDIDYFENLHKKRTYSKQRTNYGNKEFTSSTIYLHNYCPKSTGEIDFQSNRVLNFKNGVADDIKYYCDESKKKFLSNRQKYDIIIRALGSNEISVTSGSKPIDKLCIEISKVTNAQYRPEVVSKTRTTRPLKVQNLQERKNEIKNVYTLNTNENLNHKKILIVDDIRTSGTTISEITQTIKTKYPNSIIDSFCLAQTM